MFSTVNEFLEEWKMEAGITQKVLEAVTDESLNKEVSPGLYSIGSLAWHLAGSVYYFPEVAGIKVEHPDMEQKGQPDSAQEILDTYKTISSNLMGALPEQVSDEQLSEEKDFFGMNMKTADILRLLIQHQAHHRGQLSTLMRQNGLKVPGIYGPSKEEWEAMQSQQ
ncbi:DinB family protein [Metabacillus sp. GX 13764]|uniref:DinB family protein n=1 Tax=Metabacillus kandeliae TaxID=2900151 RepID=UPI001E5BD097|nr:DinB family protein [Metabacillus kandeliae]MCD7036094.1 DinB family protein [Metabacillus kandeliae]